MLTDAVVDVHFILQYNHTLEQGKAALLGGKEWRGDRDWKFGCQFIRKLSFKRAGTF